MSVKYKIFFLFFTFFIFLGGSEAFAFSCSSGSLSTICYVDNTQTMSNGEVVSGTGDLVIRNGGNLTADATDAFTISMGGDVIIEEGGQITGNLNDLIAENLTVSGTINVDGKGYAGGSPGSTGSGDGGGAGSSASSGTRGGGGAGYGGTGGDGITAARGGTYESLTQPNSYGSGGGGAETTNTTYGPTGARGGNGGGKIKITVTDTLTVNGTISADGQNGQSSIHSTSYRSFGGGGSGGSIWITTNNLAGSANITVNGGVGNSNYGGGGAGGRIAVYYTSSTYGGILYSKGNTTGYTKPQSNYNAEDGSVYIEGTNYATFTVGAAIIDAQQSGIEITGTIVARDIDIETINLNIPALASIDVSGRGSAGGSPGSTGSGYGGGVGSSASSGTRGGGGAGYGDTGGHGIDSNPGLSYGSMTQPTDYGSGGGGAETTNTTYGPTGARGGYGGGKIKITVTDTLTVNGAISADGSDGAKGYHSTSYRSFGGGGSGGSIWITTNNLAGSANITSNGGSGHSDNYGGGGAGGRIAVYYCRKGGYEGSISRSGGTGYEAGGTGTLYYDYSEYCTTPVVSTNDATNITTLRATLNGTLSDLGNANYSIDVWFEYGEEGVLPENFIKTTAAQKEETGTFFESLEGLLLPSTNYQFRAAAENDIGVFYGDIETFTTLDPSLCSEHNIKGYAWSDSIGWISFSCENEYTVGTGVDYGVDVAEETGVMSGYAWADNIGWITFNTSDLTGCPSGECQGHINFDTGAVTGWGRIVSNQEWISFSGANYDTEVIESDFHGYAWSDSIGWISFNCLNLDECSYSDYKVWLTLSIKEIPVVITRPAARTRSIDGLSVILVGNLLSTGGLTNNVWFEYGQSIEGITKDDGTVQEKSDTGIFSSVINFATPQFGELYYFRAVAENDQGTSNGKVLTFTIKEGELLITVKYGSKERGITINREGIIEIVR